VSVQFFAHLMNFRNLSGTDKVASSVLLRLFKLVFGSVTLFAENEAIVQPHLSTIITSAMKHATEVKVRLIVKLTYLSYRILLTTLCY
jgi:hypothetical protein